MKDINEFGLLINCQFSVDEDTAKGALWLVQTYLNSNPVMLHQRITEAGKIELEFDNHLGPINPSRDPRGPHPDPIGPLGPRSGCPICKRIGKNITWDPKSDISYCTCGWNNSEEAKENRELRMKNGEL